MKNSALIFVAAFFLPGCSQLIQAEDLLDSATDKYCAAPLERAIVKVALDTTFRTNDKAACVRCPGEAVLSCIGDPKELPPE